MKEESFMINYEIQDWDTNILGVKVAKILPERLSTSALAITLDGLRAEHVQLVFWCSDPKDQASQEAAHHFQGFLSDEKTTYVVELPVIADQLKNTSWELYDKDVASPDLVNLALEIGKFSRFLKDRRIGYENFKRLYTEWINNSCNKSVADDVIIIKENNSVVAMATVKEKNNRGDIGLLAVAPTCQGKGYGTQLVKMSQAYFLQRGINVAQVITQKENRPACRLYEKCGFSIESLQNFYHFWL